MTRERWEEAAAAFRRASDLKPDDPWSHNNLAIALLKAGAWEESARAFRIAIGLNPGFGESYANLGAALARLERWDDASRAYRRAAELDARDVASQENLGIVLARLGRWEEAASAFEHAIALGPDVAERHLHLGVARLRLNRWSESADALQRALELDPGLEAARQNLELAQVQSAHAQQAAPPELPGFDVSLEPALTPAAASFAALSWDESIARLRGEVARDPNGPELHANLAASSSQSGPREDTLAALRRAIELTPKSVALHQLLAIGLETLDRREEGLLIRQRLVSSDARNWEALIDFATALARLERWDEASVACQKALALNPDVGRSHLQVAAVFTRAKRWQEAAAVFRSVADAERGSADAHANLGVALAHLERWSDAARAFRAAVAAAPSRAKLHEALCAVLANAAQWQNAVAASREWVSLDPESSEAHRHLAAALTHLERVDEAVSAQQRVVDATPDDPAARLRIGIGFSGLERWEEAVCHLNAGCALAPRDPSFPFLLVEPLLRLGRGSEAVAAHRRAIELGGSRHPMPARAVDTRIEQTRAASWETGSFGPRVSRVARWFEQLAGRSAAGASGPAPAMSPDSSRTPRLLFVLDEDYGELTLLMYLALGQQLLHRSTLLLPDRLFARNANAFPARTHRYASLDDVLRSVEAEAPDVVFLCSGYLLSIHGLLSLEELERLVVQLRERGCRVVTTDPFLGILSEQDPERVVSIQIPEGSSAELKHIKSVEDQRLWTHFAHAARLFADSYHLYPACDRLPAGDAQSDVRNLSSFNPALICPELTPSESRSSGAGDASAPHWLFILSQTDYEAQAMFESPLRFADIVASRLVEAVAAGRRPILIGPNAFLDLLAPRLPTTHGIDILSYCPFAQLVSLLLSAEHAFYWNVVSHSILIRLFNRLPVVLFDKGHLVRNVPSIYDRVVQWYHRGVEPIYRDHREPLTLELLSNWDDGFRRDADRILAGFRAAPTPDELVADLMQRPGSPGLRR